jgi:hypothetical protein
VPATRTDHAVEAGGGSAPPPPPPPTPNDGFASADPAVVPKPPALDAGVDKVAETPPVDLDAGPQAPASKLVKKQKLVDKNKKQARPTSNIDKPIRQTTDADAIEQTQQAAE